MNFSTEDKIIVSHLLEVGSCKIYSLHEEYLLSPAQVVRALRNLVDNGILVFKGMEIGLAKNAKSQIFRLRHKIYRRTTPWRTIPDNYRISTQDNDWDYVPVYRKVDKRILELLDAKRGT